MKCKRSRGQADGKTLILSVSKADSNRPQARATEYRRRLATGAARSCVSPATAPSRQMDAGWLTYRWATQTTRCPCSRFHPPGPGIRCRPTGVAIRSGRPTASSCSTCEARAWDGNLSRSTSRRSPPSRSVSPAPLPIEGVLAFGSRAYDITPDGRRFLVTLPPPQASGDAAGREQINVTLDWFEELRQRVPTK